MHIMTLKNRVYFMMGLISLTMLMLSGCSSPSIVKYNPQDFINPNRVVTKTVTQPIPTPKIVASFGYGDDPAVIKAYNEFTKKGRAKNIYSKGFETFAYDAYSHPVVSCAPLRLCVVQLERGETINDIDVGDTKDWLVGTSLVGSASNGSYQVMLKPKHYDIATDLVITTSKRTYNIGLVSEKGASTHVVNFYYPQETLNNALKKAHQKLNSLLSEETVNHSTSIDVDQMNFNYRLTGDYPAWRPTRVFDDGNKTFIQMSPLSERMDLPVLYILKNHQMAMVNYRYRRPYYVIDGLFEKGYLVSGKGGNQVRVEIDNQNFG